MKKLVLVSIVLVMMLALAVPMSSTSAQEKIKIDVWIAFSDYRLDWTQDVAAEFGELYPQFEVNVTGGYSYETLFTQVAVAAENTLQRRRLLGRLQLIAAVRADATTARHQHQVPLAGEAAQVADVRRRTDHHGTDIVLRQPRPHDCLSACVDAHAILPSMISLAARRARM
mgnify:CR=1 FL=1